MIVHHSHPVLLKILFVWLSVCGCVIAFLALYSVVFLAVGFLRPSALEKLKAKTRNFVSTGFTVAVIGTFGSVVYSALMFGYIGIVEKWPPW
jgi:hypothetical protein